MSKMGWISAKAELDKIEKLLSKQIVKEKKRISRRLSKR